MFCKINVEKPLFTGDRNPGRRGGIVSSLRLSPAQRSERATRAGNANLARYGRDYYSALAKKRVKNAVEKET
jgi:hypothetical protein